MKYLMHFKRAKEVNQIQSEHDGYECEEDALLVSLNIDEPKTVLRSIQKNAYFGKKNVYKATVCVVCDESFIG